MESAFEELLKSGPWGAAVVLLLGLCAFLGKQLLKAKDDQLTHANAFSDRMLAQADHIQALVKEHNQHYEALAARTLENTKAVQNIEKTVEAHAFSCPSMDKAKFVTIKGGKGV